LTKWEEQLNQILNAILNSDYVKEQRKERDVKEEIDFYGYQKRTMDFELETLENFFNQDLEEILKVNEIWLWLKDKIKSHLLYVLGNFLDVKDTKIFLKEGLDFEMEDYVNDELKNLSNELSEHYEKKLEYAWEGLTPEQAKPSLPRGQIYVALLSEDGKLTTEPHPITTNTDAEVTWQIEEEEIKDRWAGFKRKERNIHITITPPIKRGEQHISGRIIRLRKHEVTATTIKP